MEANNGPEFHRDKSNPKIQVPKVPDGPESERRVPGSGASEVPDTRGPRGAHQAQDPISSSGGKWGKIAHSTPSYGVPFDPSLPISPPPRPISSPSRPTSYPNLHNNTSPVVLLRNLLDANDSNTHKLKIKFPLDHSLASSTLPNTRRYILQELWARIHDASSRTRVIWLFGPAGPALLQSLAEIEDTVPGTTVFLENSASPLHLSEALITLASRIAAVYPKYKEYLNAVLCTRSSHELTDFSFEDLFNDTVMVETTEDPSLCCVVTLSGLDEYPDGAGAALMILSSIVNRSKRTRFIVVFTSQPGNPLSKSLTAWVKTDITRYWEIEIPMNSNAASRKLEHDLDATFSQIYLRHRNALPIAWPTANQFLQFAVAASGRGRSEFIKIIFGYIHEMDPFLRLKEVVSFMSQNVADRGPSHEIDTSVVLDRLYTHILTGVPHDVFPLTKRILSYIVYSSELSFDRVSTQGLCNFLCSENDTFYAALQRLHSVVNVPPSQAASWSALSLYHPSFKDFLLDASRSGTFYIDQHDTTLDYVKTCLSWNLVSFSWAGSTPSQSGNRQVLPHLDLGLDDDSEGAGLEVAQLFKGNCWIVCDKLDGRDEELRSHLRSLDFRHVRNKLDNSWYHFVNRLWRLDPSIVRTEPQGGIDLRLLEHLESMTKFWEPVEPATFPLTFGFVKYPTRKYFLIGHAGNAIVCWVSNYLKHSRVEVLNYENGPSAKQLDAYHDWLLEVGWFEADSDDTEAEEQ